MRKVKSGRKAFYHTVDAMLAAILIFVFIQLALSPETPQKAQSNILEESFLLSLSGMNLEEIYNVSPTAQFIINNSIVNNTNTTLLEAVGELWAMNHTDLAQSLLNELLTPLNLSLTIYIDNELLIGKPINFSNGTEFEVAHRIISGVAKNKPLAGYSSVAMLKKLQDKEFFSYSYLGGFIGQGNISIYLYLPDWINTSFIDEFSAYLDTAGTFDVYVNGNYCRQIAPLYPIREPETFDLDACINYLSNGSNLIMLISKSALNESYIAGGYFRVGYRSPNLLDKPPLSSITKPLPGVKGIINIYDGIDIEGTLRNLSLVLDVNNSAETVVVIGNAKIIINSTNNLTKRIILTDQNFTMLNYTKISNSTIPIRIYSKDLIPQIVAGGNADVVLITDVSGSMDWRMDSDTTGIERNCDDPKLYDNDTQRLSLAKCLDKKFVEMVLNYTGNRVALVSFNSNVDKTTYLTDDLAYLEYEIDKYSPGGGTCICCAINAAYNILNSQSNSSRKKYIVVMTDGIPTHSCGFFDCEGTSTSGFWYWWSFCYGNSNDCTGNDCSCAMHNAEWSACRAHNNLDAKIYSIGFGPVYACENANSTLFNIASCGNGSYYASSDPNALDNIYTDIAQEIVNLSYKEQIAYVEGDFVPAEILPSSYINISVTPPNVDLPESYIDIIYEEPMKDCNNTFNISDGVYVIDARITSFSGPHWTKRVILNNNTAYNLSEYRFTYIELGDPAMISIPPNYFKVGVNNLTITSGDSEINDSECMKNNSLIIHAGVTLTTTRTTPLPKISGCSWQVEVYNKGIETLNVPYTYLGNRTCSYTSSNISYDPENAYDYATYTLLSLLDPYKTGKVLVSFAQEDLQIIVNSVSGIPFMWGPTTIAVYRIYK